MNNRIGALSLWLIIALAACTGGGIVEDQTTPAPASVLPREPTATVTVEKKAVVLPTAKPTRTPTTQPTLAETPTPLIGALPSIAGTSISLDNVTNLALLGVYQPEWPNIYMGATSVKYAPDGRLLAVGSINGVYVLDTVDYQALNHFEIGAEVTGLAFSPDGQVLAMGTIGKAILFDLIVEQPFATLESPELQWEPVQDLTYTQDGGTLLMAIGDRVQTWDVRRSQMVASLPFPEQEDAMQVQQVLFSPRDELIIARLCPKYPLFYPGRCSLWVRQSSSEADFQEAVLGEAITFSQDGYLAIESGFLDSTVIDLTKGTSADLFEYLTKQVDEIDFAFPVDWPASLNALSPDGQRLAFAEEKNPNRIHLVDIASGESRLELEFEADPGGLLFSPDGTSLLVWRSCFLADCNQYGSQGKNFLQLVDVETGTRQDLIEATGLITSLAYSPDGSWLAVRDGFNQVQVWDVPGGEIRYKLSDECMDCRAPFSVEIPLSHMLLEPLSRNVGFSPDSEILAVSFADDKDYWSQKGYIQLYRAENGEPIQRLENDECRPAGNLQFSPDGALLASAYRNKVCLWSLPDGNLERILTSVEDEYDYTSAVAFASDGGRLAAGTSSGVISLWQVGSWELIWSYPVHEGYESRIHDLVFVDQDQSLVSAGQDESLRVRAVSDGAAIQYFQAPGLPLLLAFSSDETLFLYGEAIQSSGTDIFKFPSGERAFNFASANAIGAAFSPDGRWLVTSHNDGKLYYWGIP